jgi:hypothetical protein
MGMPSQTFTIWGRLSVISYLSPGSCCNWRPLHMQSFEKGGAFIRGLHGGVTLHDAR